jgi:hypothetical protein
MEDDHALDPDDDEVSGTKILAEVVDEQGKTLDRIVSAALDTDEPPETTAREGEGDSTFITNLLGNKELEQGSTLQDFMDACHECGVDPRYPLRLPNQRAGTNPLYWLQIMVIAFARRTARGQFFRGALITALTGLGKTWMLGGIVLAVSSVPPCPSPVASPGCCREGLRDLAYAPQAVPSPCELCRIANFYTLRTITLDYVILRKYSKNTPTVAPRTTASVVRLNSPRSGLTGHI